MGFVYTIRPLKSIRWRYVGARLAAIQFANRHEGILRRKKKGKAYGITRASICYRCLLIELYCARLQKFVTTNVDAEKSYICTLKLGAVEKR